MNTGQVPPDGPAATTTPADSAASRFTAKVKDAGVLAARQAERAKLTTVTLPSAYAALGRSILAAGSFRPDFSSAYAEIERINGQIASIKSGAAERQAQTAEGFAAKAKAAAAGVKDAAHVKVVEHQLSQAVARLGQAVYDRHGETSGPAELVAPIAAARSRLREIDSEIAHLSEGSRGGFTPKHVLMLACVMAGLLLVAGGWWLMGGGGHDNDDAADGSSQSAQQVRTASDDAAERAIGESWEANDLKWTRLENGKRCSSSEFDRLLSFARTDLSSAMNAEDVRRRIGIQPTYRSRIEAGKSETGFGSNPVEYWNWISTDGRVLDVQFVSGYVHIAKSGGEYLIH